MSAPAGLKNTERYLGWLVGNGLLTAAVAWIAFQIQQEQIAPVAIFPLCVGAALGAGGCGILYCTSLPGIRIALAGAVVWGLLVVIGQDYIGHRYRLRQYDDELSRQNPLAAVAVAQQPELRPRFDQFFVSVVRAQPVWWSLDLILTTGATVLVTAWGMTRTRSTNTLKP